MAFSRIAPAVILLLPLLVAAASTAPTTAPAAPTTAASSPTAVFNKEGVKFRYPAWPAVRAKTAILAIAAPPAVCHGSAAFTLDIPSLPFFVPLFISSDRVESGYVKNLRKGQIPSAAIDQDSAITVAGCHGRFVQCSGKVGGKPAIDVAVILVHARKVYILSCDSDDAGYAAARSALDMAVNSLSWTK